MSSQCSLSFWLSHWNHIFIACPCACYMTCSSDPLWLDHSDYVWRRVQVMKLLIMKLSPTFYYSTLLRSKYSPQHPVLKHPQSVFLL
jgi:hypothetical protein